MSNPTSNFGWQMPTPTDLVTDLPADFEVFGQAVDTSMADLKGGTTGQILSKNSNTDMDFIWIANDQGDITGVTATSPLTGGGTSGAITVGIQSASTSQSGAVQLENSTSSTSTTTAAVPASVKSAYDLANTASTTATAAIPKSTVTAKGSIVAATASSTPANLAVGNNGETLVADSSTSTGLRYQGSMAAGKNAIINGGMDIWQRGTSFTGTTLGAYCADRWGYYRGGAAGGATWTRQSSGLTGFQYSLRAQRNSGDTSTQYVGTWQGIETINSIPYAGKTVTLSFYAKCGANFSPTSSILTATLVSGTGTDEPPYSFTGQANVISQQNAVLTTSWQRFTYTGTVASNATELAIQFVSFPTGTAGANDWYEITGVQIELGSVATAFQRNAGTIQGELAACQRYYYRSTSTNSSSQVFGFGSATATTTIDVPIKLPQTMRTIPSSVDFSTLRITPDANNSVITVTNLVLQTTYLSPDIASVQASVSGATQFRPYWLTASGSTSAYVGFSAEL